MTVSEFGPLADRFEDMGIVSCLSFLDNRTISEVLDTLKPSEGREGKGANLILIDNNTRSAYHHADAELPERVRQAIDHAGYSLAPVSLEPSQKKAKGLISVDIHYVSPEEIVDILNPEERVS